MHEYSNLIAVAIVYGALLIVFRLFRGSSGSLDYTSIGQSDLGPLTMLHWRGIGLMTMPAIFFNPLPAYLWRFPEVVSMTTAVLFVMAFVAILIPIKRDDSRQSIREAGVMALVTYGLSRAAFLIAYEWFFRGLLLAVCLQYWGPGIAIAVNVLLYALAHSHKNRWEIAGCVPLGIVLCLFTFCTGSLWPAIVLHLELAVVHEWPQIRERSPLKTLTRI